MRDRVDPDRPEVGNAARVISAAAALIVIAPDEIDMRNSVQFGQALTRAVEECTNQRLTRLVVDLNAVAFMSSAGLQELLRASDRCSRAGIELVLARPSRPVRRVLDLTGLTHMALIADQLPPS